MTDHWDKRYLNMAQLIASWSKDPSTKCGAVLVSHDNHIVSLGFNGLPRGIADTAARLHDREVKYRIILHAEENALLFARDSVMGATCYVHPFLSCSRCAAKLIQAGIARIVTHKVTGDRADRWDTDLRLAREMYQEIGIEVEEG